MVEVAKALNRPPSYVTKFFGAEVGALTNWEEKEARYIVNGVHDADKLQSLLDDFISKFVLCSKCKNPETVLSVKNGVIFRTCKACGAKTPCDNNHKLATFIKNNPPPKPVKLKQAKDTAAEGIGEHKDAGEEENVEGMVAPEGFDDGLHIREAVVDEDDWDEEAAEANRKAELAGLSERVKNSLNLKGDDAGDFQDPLEVFAAHVEALDKAKMPSADVLREEAEEHGIRVDHAVAVITQILLAEDTAKALKTHSTLFTELCACSSKCPSAFLGSLERVLVTSGKTGLVPACLQLIYNEDVLDDEALRDWFENPSKKFVKKEQAQAVRQAAAPFFNWLDEDEGCEEDSDEE